MSVLVCTALAKDITVSGALILSKAGEETYLAVQTEKPLTETDLAGKSVSSRFVQIAGLESEQWKKVEECVGKPVTVTGMLMFPTTVHHHTPLLVIAGEVKGDGVTVAGVHKVSQP